MTQKQCTKCGMTKPTEDFRYLAARRNYIAECKECERSRRRIKGDNKRYGTTKRELAVREVAVLCKLFDTKIIIEALELLQEGKV